jgi:hypothetical protein
MARWQWCAAVLLLLALGGASIPSVEGRGLTVRSSLARSAQGGKSEVAEEGPETNGNVFNTVDFLLCFYLIARAHGRVQRGARGDQRFFAALTERHGGTALLAQVGEARPSWSHGRDHDLCCR